MNDNDPAPKSRVLLSLEDGAIIAKFYSFVYNPVSGSAAGICAKCDDGTLEFYVVDNPDPTYRDCYGIDVPDDASYEAKKQAIIRATGWEFDEEFRWLETDENGEAIPQTDTVDTITAWLNKKVPWETDEDISLLEKWGSRTSQYAPGFDLFNALSETERHSLSMKEADLGGPASTVPCIMVRASIKELVVASWTLNGLQRPVL